ncbi:MAG: hypothetical protein GY870_17645 [archaeon]|nr:hypothetical protein [archaeon]
MIDSAQFLKSKAFFPISIDFEKEKIMINLRVPTVGPSIIDVYSNKFHVGMIIGIEKSLSSKKITMGQAGINRSHSFRNILSFCFIKLLEFYGLNDIDQIEILEPTDLEFNKFLVDLGFILDEGKLLIDISDEEKLKNFLSKISEIEIRSPADQLKTLIEVNNEGISEEDLTKLTKIVLQKVKESNNLEKSYWDNRQISQINVILNTASLNKENLLEKHEFLDLLIKTIIASFDIPMRMPLLERLFLALDGEMPFETLYIQKMVENMQKLFGEDLKHINKDEFREWIRSYMPAWKLNDKNRIETLAQQKEDSVLKSIDFGKSIDNGIETVIEGIIAHYNGFCIYYGLAERI